MVRGIDSATAKMVRVVACNRKALNDAIREYTKSKPCEMLPESEGVEKLHILKQPSVEISILVGEILYHCRSALDHIFFELVQKKGTPTGRNWEHSCYFPLAKEPSSFPGKIKNWFPEKIMTVLEKLQPYQRGNDLNKMLWCLLVLSNIDKHRNLSVTAPRVNVNDIFSAPTFNYTHIHPMLKDGAKLPWPAPVPAGLEDWFLTNPMKVERKLIPLVAITEPELAPRGPEANEVQGLIDHIPSAIIHYIIPVFEDFLSKP